MPYFYEPFLEAFDPALRKQLGVWYTPAEVVRYMVARVDRALRDDLGSPTGWPPTTSTSSIRAAAPAPTWPKCSCAASPPTSKAAASAPSAGRG